MTFEKYTPKVFVEIVQHDQYDSDYERLLHWKKHIENMYHTLGYGNVSVKPTQKMIDEYNNS